MDRIFRVRLLSRYFSRLFPRCIIMTQGAGLRLCFSIEKTGYRTCPGRYGKGKSMGEAFRMPDAPGGVVYRLRANEIHARHSEGSFLRLCDGRILYAYSLFSGSAGDDDPSNIAVVTSADEGSTWTEPRIVLRAEDFGTHNIMSVSLIRRLDGSIGLFFGTIGY